MIFMGNPCGYGNCMSAECEICPHYKPTFFWSESSEMVRKYVI